MLIRSLHHVSMKCETPAELEKALDFYCNLLGASVEETWPGGVILALGGTRLEIFCSAPAVREVGALRHIAFETDSADECAEAVRKAGYRIFLEPKDIEKPVPARIAFCIGPMGEQIEFFKPKNDV